MSTRSTLPLTPDDATRPARSLAIIADGNRRWARREGLSITDGHEAGLDTALARARDAIELGIRELTIFTFSTENWARPQEEIDGLFTMATRRIAADAPGLGADGVRMRFIGRRDRIPTGLAEEIGRAEELTAEQEALTLYLALDYGGRAELIRAASRSDPAEESDFRAALYAPEMHDPDMMIRTGGQRRLSNFMLWQCAYSELVFRDELWPDFGREELEGSLVEFTTRQRHFGGQ